MKLATIAALIASALNLPHSAVVSPLSSPYSVGRRKSRGHGEGCAGNKHAKSSFKQNKRRGL